MPILRIEILGSNIDIEFEEHEHKKLSSLIENYKKRLDEFSGDGKINKTTTMVFAALKIEDELEEANNFLKKKIRKL